MVMAGHFFLYLKELQKFKGNYLISFLFNWGRESVLLFFILSGIVVHYSFERKNRTSFQFIKERIIRLHPTLIISLIICLIIEFHFFGRISSINTIIGNLVPYSTMKGYLAPLLWDTNAAIWSLTFEVFFYGVFGLFIIKNRTLNQNNIYIWLIISILSIYYYFNPIKNNIINHLILMLSYSTVWIVGYLIFKYRDFIYSDGKLAIASISALPLVSRIHVINNDYYNPIMFILFSITSIPLFVKLLKSDSNKAKNNKRFSYAIVTASSILGIGLLALDSNYSKISKFLYCILPVFILVTVNINFVYNLIKLVTKRIISFFGYFGKYSYPIYLLHTPFIKISNHYNIAIVPKILLVVMATFGLSYIIENIVQPFINKRLI